MSKHTTSTMLSFSATAAKLSVGETTLRRLMSCGQFISPIQVAPRRIAFVESEVDHWVATRPRGALPAPSALRTSGTEAEGAFAK